MRQTVRFVGLLNMCGLLVVTNMRGAEGRKSVTRHFKRAPIPTGWEIPGLNTGSDLAEIQRLERERVAQEWEQGMFSPYRERLLKLEYDRLAREGTPNLSQKDIQKLHQMNPEAVEQCAKGNINMCALLTAAKDQVRQPGTRWDGESVNAYLGLERDTNTELIDAAVNPSSDPKDKRAAAWIETMKDDVTKFESAMTPDLQWLALDTKNWKDGVPELGHPVTTMSALKHRLTLYGKLIEGAAEEEEASSQASKDSCASDKPEPIDGSDADNPADANGDGEPDKLLGAPTVTELGNAVPASMETRERSQTQPKQMTAAPTQRRVEDVVELMARHLAHAAQLAETEEASVLRFQTAEDEADARVQLDSCRVLNELASHRRATFVPAAAADNAGETMYDRGVDAVIAALKHYDAPCGGVTDYGSGLEDSPSVLEALSISGAQPPTGRTKGEAAAEPDHGGSRDDEVSGVVADSRPPLLAGGVIHAGGGDWLQPPPAGEGQCISADIQAACIATLGTMATRDSSHADKIGQLEGYELVFYALRKYQASAVVQAAGMWTLAQLVTGQSVDPKIEQVAEVGSQVKPHLDEHQTAPSLPEGTGGEAELPAGVPEDDDDFESEGYGIVDGVSDRAMVYQRGGYRPATPLTESHAQVAKARQRQLAAGASTVARGTLKYAMLSMLRHKSSAVVAESTCRLMGTLADRDPSVARAIYQGGILEAISESLHTHISVELVQEECVGALAKVAANGVHFAREVGAVEVRGIEAAVTAMRTYESSPSIQEVGCRLLAHLGTHEVWRGWGSGYDPTSESLGSVATWDGSHWSANPSSWVHGILGGGGNDGDDTGIRAQHLPMVTRWMQRTGGFAAATHAMVLHPAQQAVQAQGAAVLRSVATHAPHNKIAVLEAGATELLLIALELHPDCAELQEHGLWALVALLTDMPIIPGYYGAAALHMMPVTSWVSPFGVPSAGFNADDAVRKQILDAGGLAMVFSALRTHRSNDAVQLGGIAMLACLGHGDDSTKDAIIAQEGISAILAAMKENPGSFRVMVGACAAISTIAAGTSSSSIESKKVIFESGSMSQVLRVMQIYSQPKVHAECAGAIANVVAGDSDHVNSMLQLGAEKIILNSLMQNPSWGQVQANGCIALRNLGRDESYPGQLLADGRVVPSCMADFWGTLRHSFSWYGWCLRFGTTAVGLWLSYEVVALIEALFADYVYAYFGWGYDSQGYFVELDKLYKAEGGEQELQRRAKQAVSRNAKKRR